MLHLTTRLLLLLSLTACGSDVAASDNSQVAPATSPAHTYPLCPRFELHSSQSLTQVVAESAFAPAPQSEFPICVGQTGLNMYFIVETTKQDETETDQLGLALAVASMREPKRIQILPNSYAPKPTNPQTPVSLEAATDEGYVLMEYIVDPAGTPLIRGFLQHPDSFK